MEEEAHLDALPHGRGARGLGGWVFVGRLVAAVVEEGWVDKWMHGWMHVRTWVFGWWLVG